jgi:predicted DsbA family dithiol-disulfide isomerase
MSQVTIEVFYSETCPNCPPQKDLAENYRDEEGVNVRLTDVAKKKGRAENHGVRAVPTTVVDGPGIDQKTGFKGVMAEEKLETAIEVAKGEEDPEALENPGILESLKNIFS